MHDVAVFIQYDSGTYLAAPAKYPYLRCTRILQPGMVLTIEPGIYFIESLLAPWREGQFSKHFNCPALEARQPLSRIPQQQTSFIHEYSSEPLPRYLHM